jgi:quercetin dioxygenase-like cupin family protein
MKEDPSGSSSGLNVERMVRHVERPEFRITELQISPAQEVPWHWHTNIADTFYVLEGKVRVALRGPDEHVELGPGQPWGPIPPGRAHRVTNPGDESATFFVLHGIGEYDFVADD